MKLLEIVIFKVWCLLPDFLKGKTSYCCSLNLFYIYAIYPLEQTYMH